MSSLSRQNFCPIFIIAIHKLYRSDKVSFLYNYISHELLIESNKCKLSQIGFVKIAFHYPHILQKSVIP